MAAYTDCSIQIIANTDPFFCDCSKIKNFSSIPSKEDAVKNASLTNSDWKYVEVSLVKLIQPTQSNKLKLSIRGTYSLPDAAISTIFRPPTATV